MLHIDDVARLEFYRKVLTEVSAGWTSMSATLVITAEIVSPLVERAPGKQTAGLLETRWAEIR